MAEYEERNGKAPARVVVTGVGAVTAEGPSARDLWEKTRDGIVAIRPVQHLPMDGYRTRIGGEVQVPVRPEHDYHAPDGFRDRAMVFALAAAEEAFEAGGISFDYVPPERWGVVMGTCNAGLLSGEQWYRETMAGGNPDPSLLLMVPPQALAEGLSGAFGIKGPVLSIDTACAAGANAIGYAADLIRFGQADAVLAGGADAFSDVLFAGFNSLESLSPEPAAPYSKTRQGLSLGEGSGMVVLVREDIAQRAGASIMAEVAGYGLSADGYHPTAPHPEGKGASRAIRAALAAGGVRAEDVRYVNSHGTGTPKNDPAETNATKLGLGDVAKQVAVSSTKSMIGHLLGAAGAVEGIVTIKALQEQTAPPTANFTEPDPECDLDYVPNVARPLQMDVAISNNFAFGGANACIAFVRTGARTTPPPTPDYDRVVVTGLATLTSAGIDADGVWDAFTSGHDHAPIEGDVRVGRVNFDPTPWLSAKERRRMDRLGIFSVVAAKVALEDAGIAVTPENGERIGVIFGTGVGPMESMEKFSRPLFEDGPAAANPAVFPNTVYNAAGGQVAMHVGAIGPASTITVGHAAGASAICYGADIVSRNGADAIICIAADTLTDTVIAGYRALGALAGADGGGFPLAEAGIALILERRSQALARGARIYGEVLGYGIASDGLGLGKNDTMGHGAERAMRAALDAANVIPDQIAAVWATAAGSPTADAGEAAAIGRVFATAPQTIAPKRRLGEPMGAGGALNASLALKGWQRGDERSPRGPVLVNSCSLGGTHFSIVLTPSEG